MMHSAGKPKKQEPTAPPQHGCASTHNTTACYCTFGFVAKTVVFISGGKRFISIWRYGFTFQESVAVIGKT
jgi:hypothetical protein